MAIQKTYIYKDVEITDAYLRIGAMNVVKTVETYIDSESEDLEKKTKNVFNIHADLEIKKTKTSETIAVLRRVVSFIADMDSTDNFVMQAYKKIMLKEEFKTGKIV